MNTLISSPTTSACYKRLILLLTSTELCCSLSMSSRVPESVNKSHVDVLQTIPDSWMLRECQCYYDELSSCESMKGRFYQFYIDGKQADCSQWRDNLVDCKVGFI